MIKSRLLKLLTLIPAMFALGGCFLIDALNDVNDEINVDLPKIEVVNSVNINLQGRTKKTLYPKLSQSAVKNPEFEFSSSDSSIVTAYPNGDIEGLKVGTATVSIRLKTNYNVKTSVKVTVDDKPITTYDYTLMFYMCGSDLEYDENQKESERHPFFTEDICEMLAVTDIPDEVKIIIETGGTKKWSMPSEKLEGATKISSTNLQRWEINNNTNKLRLVDTLSTNYMASESSFSEFLSWGLDNYEGKQMGVIISGHGGGIAGCAYDDNYITKYQDYDWQHTLRTYEVANAARTALLNSSKEKFTWIGYDCCLMQCADIATINADYFEYMVASQENELANGWNHDVYLPYLMENPSIEPIEFLPKICDSFLLDKHEDTETGNRVCRQTLSVLDLSKADKLISTFNAVSDHLQSVSLIAFTIAENAFKTELTLNTFGGSIFGLADFSSFLTQLENRLHSLDTESVQEAINELVYYKKSCNKYSQKPCGVNMFFPLSLDDDHILQVGKEDYSNSLSTKFTSWQNMCVKNGKFGWDSI